MAVVVCKGCEKLSDELSRLTDDIEELQLDFKVRVKEFEEHKGDIGLKLLGIDNKLDHLSDELIDHMNLEIETNKRTYAHIENVSKFMVEITTERKYMMIFLAGIIGAIVWFYTQQYLPQVAHMNALLLEISKK